MSTQDIPSILTVLNSKDFSVFQCLDCLKKHSDNIGIHHSLVQKLRSYNYDDLEFCIPQFVQLLVSFETDSMALEDFLLEYSEKYPHFSLICFWYLQASIFELRNDPESYSFQTIRKFINKLQNVLFNAEIKSSKTSEFRENLMPALVLCATVGSAIASPQFNFYASSLVKSQGRQEKSFVFKLANFQKALTKNLTMKNSRLSTEIATASDDEDISGKRLVNSEYHQRSSSVPRIPTKRSLTLSSDESEAYTTDDDDKASLEIGRERVIEPVNVVKDNIKLEDVESRLKINTVIRSKKSLKSLNVVATESNHRLTNGLNTQDPYILNTHSLPDLSKVESRPYISLTDSASSLNFARLSFGDIPTRSNSQNSQNRVPSYQQLLKVVRVNYAKKETEFVIALQNISVRLSQVPKEARLSALRAELSIINESILPAEIDIPQLFPITSNKNKKYHKILRLSVNEACVLNSAERVPFLLLIEYLSDEMDFNPFSEHNQNIIAKKKESNATNTANSFSNLPDSTNLSNLDDKDDIKSSIIQVEADLGELPMKSRDTPIIGEWSSDSVEDATLRSPKVNNEKGIVQIVPNTGDVSTKVLADQMRIASVMLQQLESSGQSNSQEFISIKNRIVQSMISLQDQFDSIDYNKLNQLKGDKPDAGQRKLENDFKLGEDWNVKRSRIRKSSAFGHFPNWDLCSVIAKNGDDLPQEAFACQLISMISNIWKSKNIGVWTKRMKILITSANSGLVETITNAISIHSVKKSLTEMSIANGENLKGRIFTLQDYFEKLFGNPDSQRYKQAQDNFARSLASYSIICYILQIKDRHNGNIMIDDEGHIIHIDFGFLLSNSPGSVGFEAAPFKLTTEYLDLLGGPQGTAYQTFVTLSKACFRCLQIESESIISLVELMQKDSNLPCFKNGENTSVLLQQRFQLHLSEEETDLFVETALIAKSLGSMYTRLYDQFQMITQGIYS
ncbi:phosphatidylinositol 4-kinase [Scheffersomyces coipomensis]|uniref:phosphatidylinositol 4-kinase n=1 Tax=Scheffersomyces coipomensis TaxID=1788519 RepID=UPI00315D4963